jgi:hypothetical protein
MERGFVVLPLRFHRPRKKQPLHTRKEREEREKKTKTKQARNMSWVIGEEQIRPQKENPKARTFRQSFSERNRGIHEGETGE